MILLIFNLHLTRPEMVIHRFLPGDYGNGPEGSWCNIGFYTRDDRYESPIVLTPNIFYINASFVRELEAANLPSTQQATAFLLAVTIFHESVHLGRNMNNLSSGPSEYGERFEQLAFKVIVISDNAAILVNYHFILN